MIRKTLIKQTICLMIILMTVLSASSASSLSIKNIEIIHIWESDTWLWFTYKTDEVPDYIIDSWVWRYNHWEETSKSIGHMSASCHESYNMNM